MCHESIRLITFPAQLQSIPKIREETINAIAPANLSSTVQNLVVLAIDEAMSSIIDYLSKKEPHSNIILEIKVLKDAIHITIEDTYNVYDLYFEPDPVAFEHKIALEKKHQLGLQIVRKVMDEIKYTYVKGKVSKLEMTKFL